jgi:hypothetical protein
MSTTKIERSIRLVGKKTQELNRTSGSSGEIFYDTDTQTLRIYASSSSSIVLASRTWVTAQNYITSTGIPSQTGQSGKYLTTNGTAVSWATVTATVTAADVGLGNVTNESKATMFASPAFTGTVSGVTATHVGLGNVTNESKATMFTSPTLTGTTATSLVLVGSTANFTDWPNAKLVASQANSGDTHTYNIGLAGEAVASSSDTTIWGVGVYGKGSTNSATRSAGIVGDGGVTNTNDGGSAIGVRGYATETHAGGFNIGLYGEASGSGTGNYALAMQAGGILSVAAQTWSLVDNNTAALSFNATGKTGILVVKTTDGSEGVTMSGTLSLNGSSSGSVTFAAGATPSAQTYTLPAAYPAANGYALVSTTGGTLSWASAGGGSGTVTSVAMSVPSFLSVSGSPITTSGTFALGLSQSPTNGQLLIGTGGSGFNFANLTAGANVTITNSSGGITIASSGGSAGITWFSNTTSGGNITVTNPTGYSTSGSTLVIVVVGLSVSSTTASSGSASFSPGMSVASQMRVLYTPTGVSPGASTTISGIGGGYAMAYAYISGGAGLGTSSTSSSSTSAFVSNPPSYTGTPRIFATSGSGSLNLATVASTASGGGPTWATGVGFAHPLDANITAAIWIGTGSWTTTATPTLTSNSFSFWYVTGVTSFS